jgi:hypothetical protein
MADLLGNLWLVGISELTFLPMLGFSFGVDFLDFVLLRRVSFLIIDVANITALLVAHH